MPTETAKNKAAVSQRKTDRRILRTRDTLGDALVALMHEKNFDDITVQDVLDRAEVGRSTFYAHYRDKDDLFLSDVEDFLELVSSGLKRQNASPKRLLPVPEFFTHIRDMRAFHSALVSSGKVNDVWALARGFFARPVEDRLLTAGVKLDPRRRSALALRSGRESFLAPRLVDRQRNEGGSQGNGRPVSPYGVEGTRGALKNQAMEWRARRDSNPRPSA